MNKLSELNQELKSMVSSTLEDKHTQEPNVDSNFNVWNTRKAWDQEFCL